MDDTNLHTSVVIELANQEDPENQKTYNNDFDDMELPKDYVIDQIFCGENITVYALFEIPDMKDPKSEVDLVEIQNSASNDDSSHVSRNPFKKAIRKTSNTYSRKIPPRDSKEDLQWCAKVTNPCHRSRSIYCLKQAQHHEIPQREEETADLKVLFSNDYISKNPKQMKFKAVSKGVNTDIAQTPKVIDDIQRAINMGFSYERSYEKSVEVSKFPFSNSSGEIVGTDVKQSISSFSSSSESMKPSKGSTPNYLFVPLLMIEERFMSHFQKEENMLSTKSRIKPKKVSMGTNTETVDSSPLTSETDERRDLTSHCTTQSEVSKDREKNEEKDQNAKSHSKKKDKHTILNEIRKLQGKLNSLIKSIEYNEISLSTDDEDKNSEISKRTSETVLKNSNKISEPQLTDSETFRRTHNPYDDIPIFSSPIMAPPAKNKKASLKKKPASSDRAEETKPSSDVVKSVSSGSLVQQENISPVEITSEPEKPKESPKNVFSGLNINWDLKTGKSLGPSKSATSSRCSLLLPKHNPVKKSMSFDLKDDKTETSGLKKIKNLSLKFEGSLKTNMRILQSGEVRLGENLTSLRREMGDEVKTKQRVTGNDLSDFHEDSEKEEVMYMKNCAVDIKKNEEEGDAKLQNFVSQKFVEDSEVRFCKPDEIASDAVLKSVKTSNLPRGKSKAVKKTEETGSKAGSDTEKPTTPGKTQRKGSAADSHIKKEVSPIKKTITRTKISDKKSEKKETTGPEGTKPKSVSGSRKFTVKSTAESKLHVDKLMKVDSDSRQDNANNQKATKANTDEKSGGKPDKLPRPCSQKREHRENATETTEKKEGEKKVSKKKSDTAVETEARNQKKPPDAEVKGNVEQNKANETKKEVSPGGDNSAWASSNSSSVVVELFSEKPTLGEEFYAEVGEDYGDLGNIGSGRSKGSESESQGKRSGGSQDKPIVKSIWALTKVLLYEDGTKKLEVLEASLTPPGYCLNSTENKPTENVSE